MGVCIAGLRRVGWRWWSPLCGRPGLVIWTQRCRRSRGAGIWTNCRLGLFCRSRNFNIQYSISTASARRPFLQAAGRHRCLGFWLFRMSVYDGVMAFRRGQGRGDRFRDDRRCDARCAFRICGQQNVCGRCWRGAAGPTACILIYSRLRLHILPDQVPCPASAG